MKCVCVLLLFAVSQAALMSRSSRSVEILPAPNLSNLTAIDNNGFHIEWEPLWQGFRSVIGYKLKIWEQPKIKKYKYEIINGVKVLVEEMVPDQFRSGMDPPPFEPKWIISTKADEHSAQSTGLEDGLIYEFRVQAVTAEGDGKLSSSMRLYFPKRQRDDHNKDLYEVS